MAMPSRWRSLMSSRSNWAKLGVRLSSSLDKRAAWCLVPGHRRHRMAPRSRRTQRLWDVLDVLRVQKFLAASSGQPWLRGGLRLLRHRLGVSNISACGTISTGTTEASTLK
jgi:hypothetical protein